MITRELLGQRIARERKQAGLTQHQLAEIVGLERTAVTRIEAGQQGIDTLLLAAIAEALGRPPAMFLQVDEEEPLEMLARAPDAHRDEVRRYLDELLAFMADYEFLQALSVPESVT